MHPRHPRPLWSTVAMVLSLAACQTNRSPSEPIPPSQEGSVAQDAETGRHRPVTPGQMPATVSNEAVSRLAMPSMIPSAAPPPPPMGMPLSLPANTENYADLPSNPVQRVTEQPLSTFSIDVDTGSYSNLRRMLQWQQRPPRDAVRIEEMLNYFDPDDAPPASRDNPFAVHAELANTPWNPRRHLLRIALKAYEVPAVDLPPSNLVFLVDTSGSMQDADKLPLVKQALRELVLQMREQDRIALVVYAGSAGLVLPPTPGNETARILTALDRLEAGGSTNGGAGIELAYRIAREAHIDGGVNRVILATDGDFNVGTIDQIALETLVAEQRRHGIALSTLGFGQGNYNDAMAEQLADAGDGNHAYIDSPREARKVLRDEMAGTLLTVARDVKIQVEFNPRQVAEYRLIGYENRQLRREDFANDAVDAGEIGAGHDVTALYELALVGSGGEWNAPLRYASSSNSEATGRAGEIAMVRLRYQRPEGGPSRLIERPILHRDGSKEASPALQWSAAVAAYGERLRGGEALGGADWPQVLGWLETALSADPGARDVESRRELIQLARTAATLDANAVSSE